MRLYIREIYLSILAMVATWWIVSYFFVTDENGVATATIAYQLFVYPACCGLFPYAFSKMGIPWYLTVLPPVVIYIVGIFINMPCTLPYLTVMVPFALMGGTLGYKKYQQEEAAKAKEEEERLRKKRARKHKQENAEE